MKRPQVCVIWTAKGEIIHWCATCYSSFVRNGNESLSYVLGYSPGPPTGGTSLGHLCWEAQITSVNVKEQRLYWLTKLYNFLLVSPCCPKFLKLWLSFLWNVQWDSRSHLRWEKTLSCPQAVCRKEPKRWVSGRGSLMHGWVVCSAGTWRWGQPNTLPSGGKNGQNTTFHPACSKAVQSMTCCQWFDWEQTEQTNATKPLPVFLDKDGWVVLEEFLQAALRAVYAEKGVDLVDVLHCGGEICSLQLVPHRPLLLSIGNWLDAPLLQVVYQVLHWDSVPHPWKERESVVKESEYD